MSAAREAVERSWSAAVESYRLIRRWELLEGDRVLGSGDAKFQNAGPNDCGITPFPLEVTEAGRVTHAHFVSEDGVVLFSCSAGASGILLNHLDLKPGCIATVPAVSIYAPGREPRGESVGLH